MECTLGVVALYSPCLGPIASIVGMQLCVTSSIGMQLCVAYLHTFCSASLPIHVVWDIQMGTLL